MTEETKEDGKYPLYREFGTGAPVERLYSPLTPIRQVLDF
jgi:hypothetical protein